MLRMRCTKSVGKEYKNFIVGEEYILIAHAIKDSAGYFWGFNCLPDDIDLVNQHFENEQWDDEPEVEAQFELIEYIEDDFEDEEESDY